MRRFDTSLFQDAEGGFEAPDLRFTYEYVDEVGHEDVAVDVEAVPLAALFQEFFETDAGWVIVQIRETAVTAEGEEMEMTFVLESSQTRWHASS